MIALIIRIMIVSLSLPGNLGVHAGAGAALLVAGFPAISFSLLQAIRPQ